MHAFKASCGPALVTLFAATFAITAHAAPASAPAAAKSASAAAAPVRIDPEKQKLVDRVLTLWHPENAVLMMVQRPAADTQQRAGMALQQARLPQDKAEAVMKDISPDLQKYVESSMPLAQASAKKAVGPAVGPILAQNFSVAELKQLIAMFESPVKDKFDKLAPQMEQAVGEKVEADVASQVNKNVQTMNAAIGQKLRTAMAAAMPASGPAAASGPLK